MSFLRRPGYVPHTVLRMCSRRSGVLGGGLRAWRGDRVLGVEAGESGSGGRSGGGYPLCTKTSAAQRRHTLCWQGRRMGCFTIPSHTGQCSSFSMLFMLDSASMIDVNACSSASAMLRSGFCRLVFFTLMENYGWETSLMGAI